jgi:hypothetical protein
MTDLARVPSTSQGNIRNEAWGANPPGCRRYRSACSTFFWRVAFRFVSFPFLVVAWVPLIKFGRNTTRPSLIASAVWLTLIFSPIDILPIPKRGRPRLIPLVMGLPTRETAERAKRGEVILGGCIVSGFEPNYYLVW